MRHGLLDRYRTVGRAAVAASLDRVLVARVASKGRRYIAVVATGGDCTVGRPIQDHLLEVRPRVAHVYHLGQRCGPAQIDRDPELASGCHRSWAANNLNRHLSRVFSTGVAKREYCAGDKNETEQG